MQPKYYMAVYAFTGVDENGCPISGWGNHGPFQTAHVPPTMGDIKEIQSSITEMCNFTSCVIVNMVEVSLTESELEAVARENFPPDEPEDETEDKDTD